MDSRPIVFAKIEYNKEYARYPPYGIFTLGSLLKQNGHNVKLYQNMKEDVKECARQIVEDDPVFLGMSILTSAGSKINLDLCKEVKRLNPEITIVWGGIHPSMDPAQCLRADAVDMVVVGEGEETILNLANEMVNSRDFENVNNLQFKTPSGIVKTPVNFMDKNPLEMFTLDWSLIDVEKYAFYKELNGNTYTSFYYFFSYGCPHNCTFCYFQNENINKKWRTWPIEVALNDIKFLRDDYGVEVIDFLDGNFILGRQRILRFTEGLKELGIKWTSSARIDYMTKEYAEMLRDNGCLRLGFGIESLNDRMLQKMEKGYTKKQVFDGVRAMAQVPEIKAICSYIIGLPTETEEESKETIESIIELEKIHPDISAGIGIYIPLPGVPLAEDAIKGGFKPPETIEETEIFNRWDIKMEMPWVTWGDTKKLHNIGYYLGLHQNLKGSVFDIPIKWCLKNRIFPPVEKIPTPIKKLLLKRYKRHDRVLTNMPFDKTRKKEKMPIVVENEC